LNPCGGGERFTLVAMQAVLEMGIEIDLTTFDAPNTKKLENAYGKVLASVINRVKKTNVLKIFDEQSIRNNLKRMVIFNYNYAWRYRFLTIVIFYQKKCHHVLPFSLCKVFYPV